MRSLFLAFLVACGSPHAVPGAAVPAEVSETSQTEEAREVSREVSETSPPAVERIEAPDARVLIARVTEENGWKVVERTDGVKMPAIDAQFFVEAEAAAIEAGAEQWAMSPVRAALPERYSLASTQTGIRNQADRGTCWAFAVVAAIEARYKRDFGLDLDLSEQYFNHVAKSSGLSYPRIYKYENQSSYWWGGGSGAVEVATQWAIPLESEAPYKNGTQMDALRRTIPGAGQLIWHWDPAQNPTTQSEVDAFEYSPLYISQRAREQAKYGVSAYRLLGAEARNPDAVEALVASGRDVIVDVDLVWRDVGGVLDYNPGGASGGGHVFTIIGYDRPGQFFWVKNSWGGSEYLKISYEFLRRCTYSGAVVDAVTPPSNPPRKGLWMGRWQMNHDGWRGEFVVRRVTDGRNRATKLGTYYALDGRAHAINGASIDNNGGVFFHVGAHDDLAPGTLIGQKFELDLYSWEPSRGAGGAWYEGALVPAIVSRGSVVLPYSNTFDVKEWIGAWQMNHDGWRGTLSFTTISGSTITGTYRDVSGKVFAVAGTLSGMQNRFTIAFPTPQTFTVQHYFWADRAFAGFTTWNGARFAVHATR